MMMRAGRHLWHEHPAVRTGDALTFGERAADRMRNAFGSWAFVGGFLGFMAAWILLNTAVLRGAAFDRYPYLGLSMMAGLQGALILIAAKRADRVAAETALHHYRETASDTQILAKLDQLLEENTRLTRELHGRGGG